MQELKVGVFGMEGHQILGYMPDINNAADTIDEYGIRKVENACLSAIGDVPEERAASIREKHPNVSVFADLESMLASDEVDLISFCKTPRAEQTQMILKALNAGKHVLAEKPMATTMEDLAKLRKAVDASGTELRTMISMPYMPEFTGMKKWVEKGVLGTIVQAYAMKSYPYFDHRPQDRAMDGGIIMQAAIHAVSFMRYVTGLDMVEVFAHDTGLGNPKQGDLQMGANMTFRLSNGGLAVILANYCNPKTIGFYGNEQLRVHGTEGLIEAVDGLTRRRLSIDGQDPCEFEDVEPERSYMQDMIDSILNGTPGILTQEDSFRCTEIVIRAQESATQGVPLKT